MKSKAEIISLLKENRAAMRKLGVKQLGIFGSYARNEQRADSDVDVIVEMECRTFDGYMDLLFFLEELFGRKVDLVEKQTIKPMIRNRVLREAVYVPNL